jgi:two-component system nitrogen regulation response regulator GlnG
MQTLLVIDDEPNIVYSIDECLSSPDLRVISASTASEGLQAFPRENPDVVLLDIRLPDMSGLDAFDRIHVGDPRVPVVMMTAYATTETAIDAMSRGAFEYLVKPVDLQRLKQVVAKALKVSRLSRRPAIFSPPLSDDDQADQIVGNSPAMQEVYKSIGRIAPRDSVVLILGESGTGKELAARAIYHYSKRRDMPFLAINCAALPDTLLESELFGHEKGAFTGADQRRIGKFEQVHGGTIFLDEIGDMSPATQAKALRLLQDQQFERLGGNTTVKTDVRVIAATNQDLVEQVADGRFRKDLFYRLNGFTIRLPPLRERMEDVPLLIDHFVRMSNRDAGKSVGLVSEDARRLLLTHDWPGNVRELQSAIRFAVVHATGDVITSDCLPAHFRGRHAGATGHSLPDSLSWDLADRARQFLADGQGDVYRRLVANFDEQVTRLALEYTDGNQAQAAELLGISRMTLRAKLRAAIPDGTEG